MIQNPCCLKLIMPVQSSWDVIRLKPWVITAQVQIMYYRHQGQRALRHLLVFMILLSVHRLFIVRLMAQKIIAGVASTLAHSESLTAHVQLSTVVTRDELIQALMPERVRQGSAYQIPDATGMVKLDAMENPYRWPQSLHDELGTRLADCALNRYPDPHADSIRAPLAQWMQIPDTLDLLLGTVRMKLSAY